MNNKNWWSKIVTAALLLTISYSSSAQTTPQIKKTIDSLNVELETAFNANDMMKVASFYSDDSEVSGQGLRVAGRQNVDKYWMGLKDRGRGWKLEVIEVGGYGDFVYQIGISDLKHMRGDKEARSVADFLLIWKKDNNGNYKIFRDYLTKTKFKTGTN